MQKVEAGGKITQRVVQLTKHLLCSKPKIWSSIWISEGNESRGVFVNELKNCLFIPTVNQSLCFFER